MSPAHCYYRGDGVQQDYAEAIQWFRTSAEQGNPDAQVFLGYAYFTGQGIPQDYVQALAWAYTGGHERGDDDDLGLIADITEKMTLQQIDESCLFCKEYAEKFGCKL